MLIISEENISVPDTASLNYQHIIIIVIVIIIIIIRK